MTADDLSAPLGQGSRAKRHTHRTSISRIAIAVLGSLGAVFAAWAMIRHDPFDAAPVAVAPILASSGSKGAGLTGGDAAEPSGDDASQFATRAGRQSGWASTARQNRHHYRRHERHAARGGAPWHGQCHRRGRSVIRRSPSRREHARVRESRAPALMPSGQRNFARASCGCGSRARRRERLVPIIVWPNEPSSATTCRSLCMTSGRSLT